MRIHEYLEREWLILIGHVGGIGVFLVGDNSDIDDRLRPSSPYQGEENGFAEIE